VKRVGILALALAGCGVDAFTAPIPDAEDAAIDGGQSEAESSADGGGVGDGSLGDQMIPEGSVEAAADGASDAGEACPMIGQPCSPVGLRKCRGPQLVWYCAGTWTSNACTQNNPACMPCEAGYCCTIGPVCP
jgi:hypothetical protein